MNTQCEMGVNDRRRLFNREPSDMSAIGSHAAAKGARTLGWASLGIGLAELLATEQVEQLLGLKHDERHHGILRTLGVRELVHGVGILTEEAPNDRLSTGMWARAAGDVLDAALLGVAAKKTMRPGLFAAIAGAIGLIGAMDLYYALKVLQHRRDRYDVDQVLRQRNGRRF